ncbi:MAG: tRNA (adenosine(37)-N6)-threonylcarbamoyltransferase complex dimerization subunit type 1 TsaB [Candidatus Eremiobacteraeota bacterium]|nr:tRNA (adenosine(37)-N6)-threonylcarbamoyltransferase complex dimerization subunit type 1 TsaB [Candidatus Eremiobacteraeota bacterium]
MNVLALEGALDGFSAAIARDGGIAVSRQVPATFALERGLGAVATILDEARLTPLEIARLAVGIGPGRFTGLRIAIAYSKELATAWRRPLVPISSFDLLEFGRTFERVLTIVVGRPGVISARYRHGNDVRRASGRTNDVLDAVVADDEARGALPVIGAPEDVLTALAERGITVHHIQPAVTPAASAAALAASSRSPAGSVHEIGADYGELPAVTIRKR